MIDHSNFDSIDRIAGAATVEESKLQEAVASVGKDAKGLSSLVSHSGRSADWRVLGYIALEFSRIAWQRNDGNEGRVESVLSDFMGTVRTRYHPGTLGSTLNALHGLLVNGAFASRHAPLHHAGEFLQACLNHPDAGVRANAVDVLRHLWDGRVLTTLIAEDVIDGLRRRLADMAVREEDELLRDDLRSMEEFWTGESA